MSYNNNPTHGSIYARTLQAYSCDHTSTYVVYKFKHTHTHTSQSLRLFYPLPNSCILQSEISLSPSGLSSLHCELQHIRSAKWTYMQQGHNTTFGILSLEVIWALLVPRRLIVERFDHKGLHQLQNRLLWDSVQTMNQCCILYSIQRNIMGYNIYLLRWETWEFHWVNEWLDPH